MNVVVLVPRREDDGWRDRLWVHCRKFWASEFYQWQVIEGHHRAGPFNRSMAVNRAARAAGDWDVALIIDSDVLPTVPGVREAVAVARGGLAASAFSVRKNLSRNGTERILQGNSGSWERFVQSTWPLCLSGALAVPGGLWDQVGGFDERFVGWQGEDTAFEAALETVQGSPVLRSDQHLWHLWHEKQPEAKLRQQSSLFVANAALMDRYEKARGRPAMMAALIAESKADQGIR